MADHKIGGLLVVRAAKWLGSSPKRICSKSSWRCWERANPARIAALVRNVLGELTKLTKAIFDAGGNIVA
jgi:hypothetical protein